MPRRYLCCLYAADMGLAEERDAANNVTRRFFAQGEQIGGQSYFYTRDHLGSVRELTDGSQTVRARYAYDVYGLRGANQITSNPVEASFGYTGHYFHAASGLHLAPYRAYDAKVGRWISRDPSEEEGGINLYNYVNGNTVILFDPLGLAGDVAANYYISSGQLTLASPSSNYGVVAKMESGAAPFRNGVYDPSIEDCRNNPDRQNVRSPDGKSGPAGPIPEGKYKIVVRPGLKYGYPAYTLVPISGNALIYNRGGPGGPFVIHAHTGVGCIVPGGTAPNQMLQFQKVIDFMTRVGPLGGTYGYLNVHR